MPSFTRRHMLQGSLILAAPRAAFGQAYPARSIRLVVPFPAGAGVSDIMARLVGQHLSAATASRS